MKRKVREMQRPIYISVLKNLVNKIKGMSWKENGSRFKNHAVIKVDAFTAKELNILPSFVLGEKTNGIYLLFALIFSVSGIVTKIILVKQSICIGNHAKR